MTFPVADILALIGGSAPYNANITCENIDDEAYGVVLQQDSPLIQFYTAHKDIYDYQIIDGNPIRLVRRPVGPDLTIDLVVAENECILRQANNPRVTYKLVDPLSLPREVDVQYIDPDRLFAVNAQPAVHHGATRNHGKLSVSVAFILANDQARALGYDLLYRLWSRKLSVSFEHPNPNIEPGDTIQLTGLRGSHVLLVQSAILTKERTSQITASALLTAKAGSIFIAGGFSDGNDVPGLSHSPVKAIGATFTSTSTMLAVAIGGTSSSVWSGQVQFTGTGGLSADTDATAQARDAAATFTGASNLRVNADPSAHYAEASLNVTSTLSALAAGPWLAAATFAGALGKFSVRASGPYPVAATFGVASTASFAATIYPQRGYATFAVTGTLRATAGPETENIAATFNIAGTLRALLNYPQQLSATYAGVGTLRANVSRHNHPASETLAGAGVASINATLKQKAQATFGGTVTASIAAGVNGP